MIEVMSLRTAMPSAPKLLSSWKICLVATPLAFQEIQVSTVVAAHWMSPERALRHGVIYRKLSGGTASESGSRFVERMLTVVATCRQRDINVLDYLTRCYQAHLEGSPIPSLIPTSPTAQVA